VTQMRNTILGAMQTVVACSECHGEGKRAEKPCNDCNGIGKAHREDDVQISIPKGIDDGQRIRLSGKGNAGSRGSEAGDLYVLVRVKRDKRFEREGDMILSDISISIAQAVLGDTVTVETVHGPVHLKIPAGTESGRIIKLKGKGMPQVQSDRTGDHLVRVNIIIPAKLSRKQKKLFEELRDSE